MPPYPSDENMSLLENIGVSTENAQHGGSCESIQEGLKYGDGDVHRYILKLHGREFADAWRIAGNFFCVEICPSKLNESEWSIDDEKVEKYVSFIKAGSPVPAVVVDYHGSFIDGGHRHAAALLAACPKIRVLVQIENEQDTDCADD